MSSYQDSINHGLNTIGMAYGIYSRGKAEGLKEKERSNQSKVNIPQSPEISNRKVAKRYVADLKEAVKKTNASSVQAAQKNQNNVETNKSSRMERDQIKDILTTGFKVGYLKAQQAAAAQQQKNDIQNNSMDDREIILKKINELKSNNKISGRVMRQVTHALREENK